MAIKELTPEQIQSWSLAEKDRWWLENVWRGEMPQLTWRSAITGMALGGLLSLTNLYIGAQTGWTLGVGITSVILAFAIFKMLSCLGNSTEFTILENNCVQSIATAAGYMTAPLISSLAAYMLVTGTVIPMYQTIIWIDLNCYFWGCCTAFPLKRRYINDEQHPFPEGRACGIVLDALHDGGEREGLVKAKVLVVAGLFSAMVKLMQSHAILKKLGLTFLAIPEFLDEWIYRLWRLRINGVELRELTVRVDTDLVMFAAGGLMGIKTGISILVGAVVNYLVIVPLIIKRGDIQPVIGPDGVTHYGFRTISQWSLWGGIAIMTAASLVAFFGRSSLIFSAFTGLFRKRQRGYDPMRQIELPMWVFVLGIPIVGGAVVTFGHHFFGIKWWLGVIALPLVFIFTLIGVNSTALTSITPTGAMGKLTQLAFGVLDPGNIKTNLMTAGITAEVAGNASNLLMDLKPGYMLGAKPRQQAWGHVLGIIAGALVSVPVFYTVFLRSGVEGMFERYAMPAATVWKAVAELLTQGLHSLPSSARCAALIGTILGIVLEIARIRSKGRFWISGIGVGLGMIIPFYTCFTLFLGSAFFYWLAKKGPVQLGSRLRVLFENVEPICGGVIAGGALMGILVAIVERILE